MTFVRHHRGLQALSSYFAPTRQDAPRVWWFFGPTGSWKSRMAHKFLVALVGSEEEIWVSGGNLKFLDGYDGHPAVLFDDFRPKDVSFSWFLRLLDRYKLQIEIKGSSKPWCPKFIIITTTLCIDECFATRKTYVPEDMAQLHRRVTEEIGFPLDVHQRIAFFEKYGAKYIIVTGKQIGRASCRERV